MQGQGQAVLHITHTSGPGHALASKHGACLWAQFSKQPMGLDVFDAPELKQANVLLVYFRDSNILEYIIKRKRKKSRHLQVPKNCGLQTQ